MINYLLLFVLVLFFTFQSLFARFYSKAYQGEPAYSTPVYSVIYGFLVALISFIMGGCSYSPSPLTLGLGVLNAVIITVYNFSLLESAKRGSYSLLMICNLFGGVLVPMAISLAMDPVANMLSWVQWLAVGVILVAFILLNLRGEKQEKPKKFYFLWVLVLAITNGLYGTLLDVQSALCDGAESSEMVVTTFLFSGIFAALHLLLISKKNFPSAFRFGPKSYIFAVCACICATGAAKIMMYLLSPQAGMNTTVLYASDNGGTLIFSVLSSLILFKERMNLKQIIGAVLCTLSIVLLNL